MRTLLGVGAVVFGVLGGLVCLAAIGLGWWAATRTADRVVRVAARVDEGLAASDARLERVEERLAEVRANLAESLGQAERLAVENAELPGVRSAIEQLLARLLPTIDRAAALADSLRTSAAGLRAAAEVVTELGGGADPTSRALTAADAIDRAAEMLNVPRERIDALKSAAAVRLARATAELSREAAAGSDRLAEGLADARREMGVARKRVGEWRSRLVALLRVAAVANSLIWLWIGLGQLCLVGWGRRRFTNRIPKAAQPRSGAVPG
jgi:hypothetical protein